MSDAVGAVIGGWYALGELSGVGGTGSVFVAGEQVAPGSVVDVTVASGTNAVPHVSGMTLAAATAMLQSAGFSAASDRPGASSTAPVTGTQPPAGTVLRVGVTVTTVVDASTPTPTPHPTSTAEGAR